MNSAGRKEIKAIELERCLMSSECIGWLRHVYVPKVGENHRPAIKSFTISQKIQLLQTTYVHLGSDPDVLVDWHLVTQLAHGYKLCYAILPHECLLGRSAVGSCAYLGPSILNTFHSDVHAFFIRSVFWGTCYGITPFQGRDRIYLPLVPQRYTLPTVGM